MMCIEYIGLVVAGALVSWLLVRSAQRAGEHQTERTRNYFKRYVHNYESKERK